MNITSAGISRPCQECEYHEAEYHIQIGLKTNIFLCHDCTIELETKLNNTMNHK